MARVELDGTTLFYDDLGGDGPLCLMLHGGLGMDHTYFRPEFDRLRSRLRVVYYDMRGNGRSDHVSMASLSIERWADDAAGLAGRLGADRFVAVGHSYGGFVAQELALRHPDRLSGLALVSTTPGQLGQTEPATSAQGEPPPPNQTEIMNSPVTSDEEMAAMMGRLLPHYLHHIDPCVLTDRFDTTVYRHDTMLRSTELLEVWSSYDRLSAIGCPVLVGAGRHDTFCAPQQSLRIGSQIPQAEVRLFEHSGHFPWLEEPEAFWTTLDGWLEDHVFRPAALA